MVSQVLNAGNSCKAQDTDGESSGEEESVSPSKKFCKKEELTVKKSNCTIEALVAWHHDQVASGESGNIVVIVEDIECFTSPLLLQDFIQICRCVWNLFQNY